MKQVFNWFIAEKLEEVHECITIFNQSQSKIANFGERAKVVILDIMILCGLYVERSFC
jgi:hypothetical protein